MADLQITIRTENLDKVREALARLSGPQARQAYANAINDAAFKARKQMQAEMGSRFDRVTPWIQRSPKVFKATPETLSAAIAPTTDTRVNWEPGMKLGGKVGVDPQQVLQAQEHGGRRRDKKSEVVLRRAGILPAGFQTAIPKTPYPGSDDGRGNLTGRFLQQLLSYLQAFGEQGYKANMTNRRKRSLHKGSARQAGRRYFVTYGRLRDNPRTRHLAPGIWAASGTGGVDVRPVLMFVRIGSYKPLLDLQAIARNAELQDYLDKRVRARVRNLAEGKDA